MCASVSACLPACSTCLHYILHIRHTIIIVVQCICSAIVFFSFLLWYLVTNTQTHTLVWLLHFFPPRFPLFCFVPSPSAVMLRYVVHSSQYRRLWQCILYMYPMPLNVFVCKYLNSNFVYDTNRSFFPIARDFEIFILSFMDFWSDE